MGLTNQIGLGVVYYKIDMDWDRHCYSCDKAGYKSASE